MHGECTSRGRAGEALAEILSMFESGRFPEAIAQTRIVRERHDRPMCEWSAGNQLLAFFHGTEDARGYRQWQQAGRHVRKGARSFAILAPLTVSRVELDPSGVEVQRRVCVGFKAVAVFRFEDTEGEPVDYPDYRPPQPPPLLEVAERLGVPVRYLPSGGDARGAYSVTGQSITLGTHDVDTFFHELAHAAHATVEPLRGGQDARQEIIAETVAAVLCRLYGFDGYLAEAGDYVSWYAGQEQPGRAVLRLLADVERVLGVILGEGASAPPPAPEPQPEPEPEPGPAAPVEPAPAVTAAPRRKGDLTAALAGFKGCPRFVSLPGATGRYGYGASVDDRVRRAYVDNVGHEPPAAEDVQGRALQFAYSPRAKDAATVVAIARAAVDGMVQR